jgi:hypothetical protein
MSAQRQRLTDAQEHLVGALDDAAEHVMYEWDKPDPHGTGTCGFAHIGKIDGRSSFVQRSKSLADNDDVSWVTSSRRNGITITIEVGALELSLRPSHRSGYRLSITNIAELVGGPAHQRLDVRKELHRLLLERLSGEWGYLDTARVYGRVD